MDWLLCLRLHLRNWSIISASEEPKKMADKANKEQEGMDLKEAREGPRMDPTAFCIIDGKFP